MTLRVEQLGKEFPTRSGPLRVLAGVNLALEPGEALAVMGPSGSGKSTLLHILGTLDRPTTGGVRLDDTDPFALGEAALADFRNRHIGFVFQDHYLLPQCSVLENVLIPTLAGATAAGQETWARDLLQRVGLADRLEHRPAELSGGERQRVAVARALIQHPRLLLADEPTGNLDRRSAQTVGELLLELHRQEKTVLVVVTHSADLARMFPRRMEMNDGMLQAVALQDDLMTFTRLVWKSLCYHWRGNLAVFLGVVVGCAVLTGALLVGDSLRGSLRALALEQLGWVDQAMITPRFFREAVARDLPAAQVAPVILLQGSVSLGGAVDDEGDEVSATKPKRRVGKVTILGVNERFWPEGETPSGFEARSNEVYVNPALADALGVKAGDRITLHLQKAESVPPDTLLGKRESRDVVLRISVSVRGILPDRGAARFTLKPSPEPPRSVFVPLAFLQKKLDLIGRINAIFVGAPKPNLAESVAASLTLDDWNLTLRSPADRARSLVRVLAKGRDVDGLKYVQWNGRVPDDMVRTLGKGILTRTAIEDYYRRHHGYLSLESTQMFLDPAVEKTADALVKKHKELRAAPTLVYLADTIRGDAKNGIPYAVVAALDTTAQPPLGPFQDPEQPPLARDEIILVDALNEDDRSLLPFDVKKNGSIEVLYYVPDARGRLEMKSFRFRLRDTIPAKGAADDPFLTPDFPGITDKVDLGDWQAKDLPFPYDRRRTQTAPVNQYWKRYRTTPRAYVSLEAGQELWKSRFGKTTSIRFAPTDGDLAGAEKLLRAGLLAGLKPSDGGFVFDDIKGRALEAGGGATDFGMYFLGFSFFLIAAALLLVGLLFRLNLDRRAGEIGLLLATGYRPRTVRRLLLAEGGLIAAVGAVVGLAGALVYAGLLLEMLSTYWPGEVRLTFLQLHATPLSLLIGYFASLAVSVLTIAWTLRVLGKIPPRNLLAGETTAPESFGPESRRSWSVRVAIAALLGAAVCLVAGFYVRGHEAQATTFFGGGALLLTACLAGVAAWMRRSRHQAALYRGPGALTWLGVRNAGRHAARSLLTVGLLASATFLVVAVESFHKEAGRDFFEKGGGSGGFRLLAEADVPYFEDLNDPKVRTQLNATKLDGVAVYSFGVRPGDDASCLNLYQPLRPRILGVPETLIHRGGFTVSGRDTDSAEEKTNPWLLLHQSQPDGAIPVLVDANSAQWILKVSPGDTLEVPDENGDKRKLRVVGLLHESIFQSEVLMAQDYFKALYRLPGGFQYFLVECPEDKVAAVKSFLESALGDHGVIVTPTEKRLEAYLAVENTYLATFQALGGFGLLLGALGLAVVLTRSVWERRGELALLRALGFRNLSLGWLVLAENCYLLVLGLGVGAVAALAAVAPHLTGDIVWTRLGSLLGLVLVVGLIAATAAVAATLRAPLLTALRRE